MYGLLTAFRNRRLAAANPGSVSRGHPKCKVTFAGTVIREVRSDCSFEILELLAKSVRLIENFKQIDKVLHRCAEFISSLEAASAKFIATEAHRAEQTREHSPDNGCNRAG
jgi:hypothetical protein